MAGLYILWQYAVTGDPLLNPYTLWWPYDKVGFGPGHGTAEQGHNLLHAYVNTRMNLWFGAHDLFGWGKYSWIFLPFGLLAIFFRRNWRALLISSVIVSLVLAYGLYWVGFWGFGPRYYYEGLYSLTLLSSVGIFFLAGFPIETGEPWRKFTGWQRLRPLVVGAFVIFLVSSNLVYYTPARLGGLSGLYGMDRETLRPFEIAEAQNLTPALVIVHTTTWTEYGVFLDLSNPYFDSPFIFALSRTIEENTALTQLFPERQVYHYYPNEPYLLYHAPHPAEAIDLLQFE